MNCPRCKNSNYCKDGFAYGRQRYQCKECKYRYTVEQRNWEKSIETKKLAINMYLEGLGFRSIGRILQISYGTVAYWVKKYGSQSQVSIGDATGDVLEMDELHTYVQSKKTTVGSG